MAIITISRQLCSLGDEICAGLAQELGYRLITRADIEKQFVRAGFSLRQFAKFDERKPDFFLNLSRDRDRFLNLLRTAILKFAAEGDCIFMGRGASSVLKGIPGHVSARFVSEYGTRLARVMQRFSLDKKGAQKKMRQAAAQQSGFYRNFFDCDVSEPTIYHFVLNTDALGEETCAKILAGFVRAMLPETAAACRAEVEERIICQFIVNLIAIDYGVNINSLTATADGRTITFHGVASSSALVERALKIAALELSNYDVASDIKVVQDFKSYKKQ